MMRQHRPASPGSGAAGPGRRHRCRLQRRDRHRHAPAAAPRAGSDDVKIAFLMPDIASTRYELQDKPRCSRPRSRSSARPARSSTRTPQADAAKQQQQANSAFAQGVKAIVLDPVDSAAAATIVQAAQPGARSRSSPTTGRSRRPRPTTTSPSTTRRSAPRSRSRLVDHLKKTNAKGGLLQINGSPTDAAAGLIKKGVHSVVDASGLKLLAEYDTPDWAAGQGPGLGERSDHPVLAGRSRGVVAANDGTGGGAIAAFKAAGAGRSRRSRATTPSSPRSSGSSPATSTTPSPSRSRSSPRRPPRSPTRSPQGEKPAGKTTLFDTPSQLFTPTVVTQENIKKEMFDSGLLRRRRLHRRLRRGCAKLAS